MNVRNPASVQTGAVRTFLVLTVACATRASSTLQTAKVAVVNDEHLPPTSHTHGCMYFCRFELLHWSNFFQTDIDECADVRLCANGRCINTDGSFKCQCYPGYQRTQEGSHCEGVKESRDVLQNRCPAGFRRFPASAHLIQMKWIYLKDC